MPSDLGRYRWWISLASLLLVGYWCIVGGAWGPRFPSIDTWVASTLLLALVGFLRLRPRLPWYLLGVLSILSGFTLLWIISPVGALWISNHLPGAPRTELYVEPIYLIWPFPLAGWMLLATSIGYWKGGIGLYFGSGLLLGLIFVPRGQSSPLFPPVIFEMIVMWPAYVLGYLGSFGLFGR